MSRKVLIFDDDEDIVDICTFVLEEAGWVVQAYRNCDHIVERVTDFAPHVILMDNWIPADGGITATRQIKADQLIKHIPVIYFSANSDIEKLAAMAGADTYIPKPFDLDVLKAVLAAHTK